MSTVFKKAVIPLVMVLSLCCSAANAVQETEDSLKALAILDQLMGNNCQDPVAFELRGDALANLGMESEARRAHGIATKLIENGPGTSTASVHPAVVSLP